MAPDAFFEGDNVMTKTPSRLSPPLTITENWAQMRGVATAWKIVLCRSVSWGCEWLH